MLPLLLGLWLPLPQEPPPAAPPAPPSDLAALAARVDAAHRPHGPVAPVTALRANLELHVVDREQERRGMVALDVMFLQRPTTGRQPPAPLIRYDVLEAGAEAVRGRDRNGPWQLFQGKATDLRKAEFVDDLAACQRHTNLARQLLRFLDPGAVLRALENPGPVQDESLPRARQVVVACHTVAGDLPAFPLLQQGGDDAPVHLKVWVDAATGRLLTADVCPRVDGKPDEARLERIHLVDLHEQDDLLVPRSIEHLFRTADGTLRPQSRAVLTSLSLRPELRVEDFDRPQ
ncbi:MAG: hypothetical protein JNL08_15340 [Planctomycetes bacterium]|nr:hypothetical protein [Planctomycetota bacterium]